ncbi:hypothetical protein CORMATOL_01299 [Corynebacterium matruchotii ATCC 33806]|uniref:Uncharacterized protein n=1 Tax=Corynebacterium matruchotii ATCC 33806 TaxID=566549 RepID=C0E2U3_9CORY|nr:hypothetical protein CORMATOL_01299 [Corynebacterium matruchotii ATCC 33806]
MSYRQSPNGVVEQHFYLGLIGEAARRVAGGGQLLGRQWGSCR